MRAVSTPGRTLRQLAAWVTAILIAGGCLGAAASGHGGRWPYHELGPRYCLDGQMNVYPPADVRSAYSRTWQNPEQVKWKLTILRWESGRWRYDSSTQWAWGSAHDYGMIQDQLTGAQWYWPPTYQPFTSEPVTVNRAGLYKLRNTIYWSDLGRKHRQSSGTCRYTSG